MIHNSAIIHNGAILGSNVEVGPYTIVHPNAIIEDGTIIEGFCEVGYPSALADNKRLIIGKNSLIRSHSTIYQGSIFGPNLVTGHKVTIREKTIVGSNFQIGTLGDIQGHCQIGSYVKCHSNVHIGQGSIIDDFVWIFPYVVLTNDPHPPSDVILGVKIESFAVIATMSVILPGVNIGEGALVAAHSCVNKDVAKDSVVGGSPAKFLCETSKIPLKNGTGEPAYPWRRHFHRGYDVELVKTWISEFTEID